MKELRIYPPPPGQTDLFGDPAFACAAPTSSPVSAATETIISETTTGQNPKGKASGKKTKPKTPAGQKKLQEETPAAAAQPVILKVPAPEKPLVRKSASEFQERSRTAKRLRGLSRLELWIPSPVKLACRAAAKRQNATMDAVAGEVLAGAFGTMKQTKYRRER
jgi:hypothetical protein